MAETVSSTSKSFYVDSLILNNNRFRSDRMSPTMSTPPAAPGAGPEVSDYDVIGKRLPLMSNSTSLLELLSTSISSLSNQRHQEHQHQPSQLQQQAGYLTATSHRSTPYPLPVYHRPMNQSSVAMPTTQPPAPSTMHPSLRLLHGLSLMQLARAHQQLYLDNLLKQQQQQPQHLKPVLPMGSPTAESVIDLNHSAIYQHPHHPHPHQHQSTESQTVAAANCWPVNWSERTGNSSPLAGWTSTTSKVLSLTHGSTTVPMANVDQPSRGVTPPTEQAGRKVHTNIARAPDATNEPFASSFCRLNQHHQAEPVHRRCSSSESLVNCRREHKDTFNSVLDSGKLNLVD